MSAKLTFTLLDAAGAPDPGQTVQVKIAGTSTVVARTSDSTLVDNGDGTYVTASTLANGSYSVYTGSGSGAINKGLTALQHIDSASVPSSLPVPVAEGGTGATTAAAARTALGVAIGTNVQAYDPYLTSAGSMLAWWFGHDDDGPTLLFLDDGAYGAYSGSAARSALGLGSAAVEDASEDGESSKLVKVRADGSWKPPVRTSHLSAVSANAGFMYRMRNVAGGTEGIYYIGQTASTPDTYGVITVEEHAIGGGA